MLLSPPSAGNRGRKAVSVTSLQSAELVIWRYFAKRFLEAYRSPYPWDGEGQPYPIKGNPYAATRRCPWDGTWLPRAEDNAAALTRIVKLARGDAVEACARIERLCLDTRHAALGVSLRTVATWWDEAHSADTLLRRSRLVIGELRGPAPAADVAAKRAAFRAARGGVA